MKTHGCAVVAGVLSALSLATPAARGRGADSPPDAIIRTRDLGRLSAGVEAGQEMRRLRTDDGDTARIKTRMGYGFLSLDVCRWLTVSAGGGVADAALDRPGVQRSGQSLWMTGFQAGLWQHDIFEPAFLECRGALQLLGSYWDYDLVDRNGMRPWHEWRGALLLSAERFAKKDFGFDVHASPYSLRLFLGPYYSEVDPAGYSRDVEIGGMGGMDIKLAKGVSVGYEVRYRDYTTHMLNAVFHF
jgi:hypothetical protein